MVEVRRNVGVTLKEDFVRSDVEVRRVSEG